MATAQSGGQRPAILGILFGTLMVIGAITQAAAGGLHGDFNGDGFDDLAIGVPNEDISIAGNAGAVNVIYGSKNGLRAKRNQFWNQNVSGVVGDLEGADQFGTALAIGDFDKDGFDDLAIGVPGESVFSIPTAIPNTGAVNVLYGSKKGLTAKGSQFWSQATKGIKGVSEPDDRFGEALAAGDFNNDGYDDLAIGAPFDDLDGFLEAGTVNVIYGSRKGLRAKGNQFWHQNSRGIRDAVQAFDRFGSALAAADFDKDGYDDLAIGVPFEQLGTALMAGAVNVIYGSKKGLRAKRNQFWHQDKPKVKGKVDGGEEFGYALATGKFDKDDFYDLAVGVPFEDIGTSGGAGAVNVLYGAAGGLTAKGNQFWHQDKRGVEDMAEPADFFGRALSAGRFNQDRYDDLAIGVPSEDVRNKDGIFVLNAGAVNVLYGTAKGLKSKGDQLWHQGTAIAGNATQFARFGSALSAGDFDNDGIDDLPVGAPNGLVGLDAGGAVPAGNVSVIYGTRKGLRAKGSQLWHQNQTGIKDDAEIVDEFGAALP